MKAQIPATGITQTGDWHDSKSFTVKCECHSVDHDVNMWIEVGKLDSEVEDIEVGFYVETWTPFWDRQLTRMRMIWNILIHGHHRQEHHLILNKQSAVNFAETILREVRTLEEKQHGRKTTRKSNNKK